MRVALREKITRIAYQNLYLHSQRGLNGKRKKSFHYSFITLRNKILYWEINREDITHPEADRWGYFGATQHSEFRAIQTFPYDVPLNRTELWNIRINRAGDVVNSCPCDICTELVHRNNFKHVFYTNERGRWELL